MNSPTRSWRRPGVLALKAMVLLAGVLSGGAGQAREAADATVLDVLIVVGSESLAPVIELWSKDLTREFPGRTLRVQLSGSDTGPAALADGAAHLAAMSRAMNAAEINAFEARRGFRPTPIRVAIDAVTVLVNAVNPIRGLTLAQVDAIFSSDRRCGGTRDIVSWGQVTPQGVWLSRPMQAFGRSDLSGTRDYFRERALCGGEFKESVVSKRDSRAVVQAVGDSANAIGYAAMAFRGPGARALPLASTASGRFVEPNAANVLSGDYPLTRYLYLYVAKPPGQRLPIPIEQFVGLALSAQGQKRVAQAGYIPLPSGVVSQEMAKLH